MSPFNEDPFYLQKKYTIFSKSLNSSNFDVFVNNLEGKNYSIEMKSLRDEIVPESSSVKVTIFWDSEMLFQGNVHLIFFFKFLRIIKLKTFKNFFSKRLATCWLWWRKKPRAKNGNASPRPSTSRRRSGLAISLIWMLWITSRVELNPVFRNWIYILFEAFTNHFGVTHFYTNMSSQWKFGHTSIKKTLFLWY